MAKTARKSKTKPDRTDAEDAAAAARSRPAWSGNMRLALVSVAVKVYPATRPSGRIRFHQVHQPSGKRVRHQKIVPGIGPVDTDEIVKGYELDRDRYLLIDPEEIDALKLETRHTLDLVQFVEQGEIDPLWFDRPYYVVPDGENAEEAYGVLRTALRRSKRLGIGQFVMRGREHLAAIKPCGQGLLLETMRFADEVRRAAPFFASIEEEKPEKELLDLAQELIERKVAPFDPAAFEDQYAKALEELIEAKAKKQKPVEIGETKTRSGGAEVVDLVEALKKSVKSSGASSGKRKKA